MRPFLPAEGASAVRPDAIVFPRPEVALHMDFDTFVLAAATADLADEPRAREHADAVEFRMDLASDPLAALDGYDGELPLLVTNRAEWEGGNAAEHGRYDALCAAVEHPAVEAVDVELRAFGGPDVDEPTHGHAEGAERVRDRARDHGATVVVSVHDFERTPSREELEALLEDANEAGDVGKVAVTARDRSDALDLLAATHAVASRGGRVATMAMGEAGKHTRAVAPVYGSRIGYAPVDPDRATAPGQYDLATLRDLVDRLV